MKKIIYIVIGILFFGSNCLAVTALYRISSGEVLSISIDNNQFENDPPDRAVISNATYPDGTTLQKRVLGSAKILDGTIVRNATQQEIDGFQAYAIDDYNSRNADAALEYFQSNKMFRLAVIAVIRGIVKEDNDQRQWIRDFKGAVAASTSLSDFQSRVAALNTPVDREVMDAKTYILNQINKDD